jgi:branched-chain amino acid transport system substrate-binding protein
VTAKIPGEGREKVNGELYNVEFETFKDVKDPGKSQK